ncbi:MAG: ribosomal protein S18-alanine N-acetyltransferase [Bacilli bacterium]|jgi:ribosomal-protein-alanine N-acetyltransferase|nr:ribosomal protein S18-alanine N-acetyltransferase [Bacilli bacterium]
MEEKKLIIRPMTFSDIDAVDQIAHLVFPDPWPKSSYTSELNNDLAYFFVMTYAEVVIGYIHFWVTFDSVAIVQFAIHPALQGKKLGSLLMAHFLDRVERLEEVRAITLEVRTHNEPAIALYLNNGFNIITTKKKFYSNGDDAYYMVKVVRE